MTVPAISPRKRYNYTGPGSYSFDFPVFKTTDVVVSHLDTTGQEQTLTESVHYTISITAGVDGGIVTTTSPVSATGKLTIYRDLPITQETDWVNNDPFDAQTLEDSIDRVVMILQQMNEQIEGDAAVVSWRGDWQTAVTYSVRDIVTGSDTNIYLCLVDHTSGTFTTDLAAGYWQLVVDVEAATTAAAAALVSEANAKTSEENAANCSGAAYDSAVNSSNSAAASAASAVTAENAKVVAVQAALDAQSPNRSTYTLATSGSVALDPDNGVLQVCDMTGSITFTDSFDDTQYIELQLRQNSQAPTFPTHTKIGGNFPLHSTNWQLFKLWKVGTELFIAKIFTDGS